METPPEIPPASPPPPLGRPFFVWLFAPIGMMGLAAALSAVSTGESEGGIALSFLAMFAMLVASIVCAVKVGRRSGGGWGFLAFIGIQILYLGVAFAGCAVALSKVNFH